MKILPFVKVILLCYNSEKTIEETLRSLLNQSYKNYEIHVLENASTDRSLEIINKFKSDKLFVHSSEKTITGYENYDRAFDYAEKNYSAIFHSDDVYDSQILAKQVLYLEENPSVGIVFTQAYKINEESRTIGQISFPWILRVILKINPQYSMGVIRLLKYIFKFDNFLVCPSAMAKSSCYKAILKKNRYDLFKSASDVDNWLRLAEVTKIGFITERLIKYRISQSQYSCNLRQNRKVLGDAFKVYNYYRFKYAPKLNCMYLFFLKNLKVTDSLMTCFYNRKDHVYLLKRFKRIRLLTVLKYSMTGIKGIKTLCLYSFLKVYILFLKK